MNPLVILELDSGDERLLNQFIAEGSMPVLAEFRRDAKRFQIGGKQLHSEMGAWSTIWSGVPTSKHGYYMFRALRPGSYDLERLGPRSVRSTPFWSKLQGTGRKAFVMDLTEVSPDAGLEGVQISYWRALSGLIYPVETSVEPKSFLPELIRKYGPQISGQAHPAFHSVRQIQGLLDQELSSVRRKTDAILDLLREDRYDLIAAGFSESHSGGHRYWDYHYAPDDPRWKGSGIDQALRRCYQAVDTQIGRILSSLPDSANVVMLSAYGLKPEYPTVDLAEAVLRMLGYQASHPPGRGSLRDLIPLSWRAKIGDLLSIDTQERLIANHFRSATDWKKTTAFATPGLYSSYVRINLAGREPDGIVKPGREYVELLDGLEKDFLLLVDPVCGKPAVSKVRRLCEVHDGEPPWVLPDLIVSWHEKPHMMTRLTHPKGEVNVLPHSFYRSTYHTYQGFAMARGPGVGEIAESMVDVCSVSGWLESLLFPGEGGALREADGSWQ